MVSLVGLLSGKRKDTSAERGPRSAFCSHIELTPIFGPPPVCTPRPRRRVGRAERGPRFSGKGRDGKGYQFNSRKPTSPGRIRQAHRLRLCVWG